MTFDRLRMTKHFDRPQDDKGSQNKDELIITSKRIDPAAGTHSVKYTSEVDDIEIIHTAHNRKGFAAGALLAAEFIYDKKGVFNMKDVLDFFFFKTNLPIQNYFDKPDNNK